MKNTSIFRGHVSLEREKSAVCSDTYKYVFWTDFILFWILTLKSYVLDHSDFIDAYKKITKTSIVWCLLLPGFCCTSGGRGIRTWRTCPKKKISFNDVSEYKAYILSDYFNFINGCRKP